MIHDQVKFQRNQPCPCGSGKKYKHCHIGRQFDIERDLSLHARNRVILRAAQDIFGFNKGRTWADFKQTISGTQIKEFYEVQASLWVPETDWAGIMPAPDGKLRGLYLGDIRPQTTLRNVIRFSLYSDQLFVIDPFHNPWILQRQFNPIENPDQYKADTLNLIYFLFSVAPWIESGILYLIPDPGSIDVGLKWETARLAKARRGDRPIDPRDLEEAHEIGHDEVRRVLFALPEADMFRMLEKVGEKLSDDQKRQFASYARQALRSDPVALEQPPADSFRGGQMMPMRGGVNLETALLICSVTGAFPYTNMWTRWEEITEAREQMSETARIWSPLTQAFQALEFRFLDNVDPAFAHRIRQDGRLESFRKLLRKIGSEATEITNPASLDGYVRDCKDGLTGEYLKAQAEWQEIDLSFVKWAGGGIGSSFIAGQMVPNISALSAAAATTLGQLAYRYLKQQQFRKANPMSVFIDLSRKDPPGGTTLF